MFIPQKLNCKQHLRLCLPALEIYNDKSSRRSTSITKRRNNMRKKMCRARNECTTGHLISHWLDYVGKLFIWEYEREKMKVNDVLLLQWALLSYCSRKRSYIACFYFPLSVSWRKYKKQLDLSTNIFMHSESLFLLCVTWVKLLLESSPYFRG
jgi:hypothetical protein